MLKWHSREQIKVIRLKHRAVPLCPPQTPLCMLENRLRSSTLNVHLYQFWNQCHYTSLKIRSTLFAFQGTTNFNTYHQPPGFAGYVLTQILFTINYNGLMIVDLSSKLSLWHFFHILMYFENKAKNHHSKNLPPLLVSRAALCNCRA